MNIFIIIAVLLHTIALTNSCSKKSSPTDTQDTTLSYYPLKLGNTWRYEAIDPTFAEFHRVVTVVAESHKGSVTQFEIVDSTFNANALSYVHKDTLLQEANTVRAFNGRWLINFDATAPDGNDNHGYVSRKLDTLSVPAGLFQDVVVVNYPAQQYDGMATQYYARGVGLIKVEPFGLRTHLTRAVINGKVFGK